MGGGSKPHSSDQEGAATPEKATQRKDPQGAPLTERADLTAGRAEGVAVERWGNPEVLDLVRNDPTIPLDAGQLLFKEGDAADGMYIVKSGALRIRSGSVVYEDAVAGGVVGEMGIVEDDAPRTAMVYALERSEVVKISEPRFFAMIAETPAFARTVMRVLSRRLRQMNRRYQPEQRGEHVRDI